MGTCDDKKIKNVVPRIYCKNGAECVCINGKYNAFYLYELLQKSGSQIPDNIQKLFFFNPSISTRKISLKKKQVIFSRTVKYFDGKLIKEIIQFINCIHTKYKSQKIPIVFSFGNVEIVDKLTYVIFECICYSLIREYGHHVEVYWRPKQDILVYGIFSSPLKLLNCSRKENAQKYIDSFQKELYKQHFRRLIYGSEKQDTNYVGKLMQEIDSFLKFFSIIEEYRDQISEVIGELVGNACEHGHADCLLDIDVTADHIKSENGKFVDGAFYGINIVILNFSNNLLSEGISQKLQSGNLASERYQQLFQALKYHNKYFDSKYGYDDFCNLASLQDKISGREEYSLQGGTGLTKLILALQSKSDMDNCYVLSGKRCVIFKKEILEYDNNNWLGFNKEKDFFSHLPEEKIITDCDIYFPGTAYNLNFVIKREGME